MITRHRDADVIVVGAGPAGAVSALLLARAGYDVLLLDRAQFPRTKPCGDCLSAGAAALLQRLGVLDQVLERAHAHLRGWRIIGPRGATLQASFPDTTPHVQGALAVRRSIFDDVLVQAARREGATLQQTRVTDLVLEQGAVTGVVTAAGIRRARVVIGADGLRSVVAARLEARSAGSLRKLSLTYHVTGRTRDDFGEMHVGDGFCAGIAPVDEGAFNLTLVADAYRFGRAFAQDRRSAARSLLDQLPRLTPALDTQRVTSAQPCACGPFDRPVSRVTFNGAALVGDAAGYYDPFTGQGVYQAMASAELLAACVARALHAPRVDAAALRPYAAARARLLRGAGLVQHAVEAVLSRPALAEWALTRIARAPLFAETILNVTGDIAPPARLLSPRTLAPLLFPQPEPL